VYPASRSGAFFHHFLLPLRARTGAPPSVLQELRLSPRRCRDPRFIHSALPRPRPENAFRDLRARTAASSPWRAQLLASVSEGWFTIIAGTSRYWPLQRHGAYDANGKCGNIQQLPGIKECVNCEILAADSAAAAAVPLRCWRNGNVTSLVFAYSRVAQLLPLG